MKNSMELLNHVAHKDIANYLKMDATNFSKLLNRIKPKAELVMATKARKSGKSKSTPSNGDTRKSKTRRSAAEKAQPEVPDDGDTSERLEKRIEDRLSRIEGKLGASAKRTAKPGRARRKTRKPTAKPAKSAESIDDAKPIDEPEDDTISVKRLRRRAVTSCG